MSPYRVELELRLSALGFSPPPFIAFRGACMISEDPVVDCDVDV